MRLSYLQLNLIPKIPYEQLAFDYQDLYQGHTFNLLELRDLFGLIEVRKLFPELV